MSPPHVHPLPATAFRSYFEIFNGHGEVDAQSLENILLLVGISLTPAQVDDALTSADIDGEWGQASLSVPGRASHVGPSVTQGSTLKGPRTWSNTLRWQSGNFSLSFE